MDTEGLRGWWLLVQFVLVVHRGLIAEGAVEPHAVVEGFDVIEVRELTEKAIRRGAFLSVADLEAAIHAFLDHYNDEAKPFVWTASANAILAKLAKVKSICDTLH